jgi:antitoxin Phd
MASWQMEDLKDHIPEVVEEAQTKGPQFLTRAGDKRAVVLSVEEYRALASRKMSLGELLLTGPKFEDGLEIKRDKDCGREIEF